MNPLYTNGFLLIFSALVSLVTLSGNLMEHGKKDKCVVYFQRMVVFNVIYNLAGACGNLHLFFGGAKYDLFFRIMDILSALSFISIMLMVANFMVSYISMHRAVPERWMTAVHLFVSGLAVMGFIYMILAGGPDYAQSVDVFRQVVDVSVLLYALFLLVMVLIYRKCFSTMEWFIINSIVIVPAFAALIRLKNSWTVTVHLSITLCVLLINNFLHLKQAERLREQARLLRQQESELLDNQVQLMMSQIRPHFIFNVLNTIYILCEIEPLKAQKAIEHFSNYLRTNLDSLSGKDIMIPLNTELEHVDHYLQLEKMRYGDELQVVTDISARNFWVPSLTIQPIVENAVKHGIHSRPDGGVIMLSTRETEDFYEVSVRDNGNGFDPSAEKNDGKKHVGLRNVRERLAAVCGGTLTVDSKIGEETLVRMQLPKGEWQEEKEAVAQIT